MALTYTDVGRQILQENMVDGVTSVDYIMRLYSAGTVAETAVLGDFTACTGAGYADTTMTGANWTPTSDNPSVNPYPKIDFIFTGAEASVKGYLLFKGTILIGAEDFSDGPYVITSSGGTVSVTYTQNLA